MTVGYGISPYLLTLPSADARGLPEKDYRRWGIAPRPENKKNILLLFRKCKSAEFVAADKFRKFFDRAWLAEDIALSV